MEQIAQIDGRCLIPGKSQGQIGWSFEKPVVMEGIPPHCRSVEVDELKRSFPT